jgi:hypothetical protein
MVLVHFHTWAQADTILHDEDPEWTHANAPLSDENLVWTQHAKEDIGRWLHSMGGISRPCHYMTHREPKGVYVLDGISEQDVPDLDHVQPYLARLIPASVLSHLRSPAMFVSGNPADARYWVFFVDTFTDAEWETRGTKALQSFLQYQ